MTFGPGPIRGRRLSVLSAAICHYSPASPAWLDFVAECQTRLKSSAGEDVTVPPDMWAYWSSVAAGENSDYDANGARIRKEIAYEASKFSQKLRSDTMTSTELVGRRVRLLVHSRPRRVVFEDAHPLTQTTEGTADRFVVTDDGLIGLLNTDDGEPVAFDCEADIQAGRIEIEVIRG